MSELLVPGSGWGGGREWGMGWGDGREGRRRAVKEKRMAKKRIVEGENI